MTFDGRLPLILGTDSQELGSHFFKLTPWTTVSLDKSPLDICHLGQSSLGQLLQHQASLPSKVVFLQRLSSIKGCLPSKVVFHQRSSSFKGCLPSKVIFHQRLSSIKGYLPSKVVFHQKSSSIKCCLSSKFVFHQRLYSVLLYQCSRTAYFSQKFFRI